MATIYDTYQSPFAWRYSSMEMRRIWSEAHRRRLMRQVWLALATAQHQAGLVSGDQLSELREHVEEIDMERALELEKQTRHDVMAEIKAFAEICPAAGGIIHLGATSADITDNADVLRQREAVQLVASRLRELLGGFADRIEQWADKPIMGYTHIQPAEPTTLGYRLSLYAQDLLSALQKLRELSQDLRGKGFKGAVGTQASFERLLEGTGMDTAEMEAVAMRFLDLPQFEITGQTYPRSQDLLLVNCLAELASALHKFALDFRLMQSPAIGEWSEPFARDQVGSSAMPFKRNPILSENICSLARYVASLPSVAWENTAHSALERTLDDSANRRLFMPEAFLAVDEMLLKALRLVSGMVVDETAVARNLARFGPFAATERLLMALVVAGADRQEAHEWIRQAALMARQAVEKGEDNPLTGLLISDGRITKYLNPAEIKGSLDAGQYIGTAPERTAAFVIKLRSTLSG